MNNTKLWNIPTFTISIDTELAWGSFDHNDFDNIKWKFEGERTIIDRLLYLFDTYDISVTWAIVGHLFLDGCSRSNNIKHPEIIRPRYSWYKKDWFEKDPASSLKIEPIWYGKDILLKILRGKQKHDIGCHSFSHIIYGDPGCSNESADSDLSECINIADKMGLTLKSFIFPRNMEGHLPLLKKYGFNVYRGKDNTWFYNIPYHRLQRISHYVDQLLSITPRSVKIEETIPGLFNIPGSMLYMSMDGIRKIIPLSSRVLKAKKGIEKAIKENGIFHLWFHPFNLVGPNDKKLLSGIEDILKYAKSKEKEGILRIMTMQEIVKEHINA